MRLSLANLLCNTSPARAFYRAATPPRAAGPDGAGELTGSHKVVNASGQVRVKKRGQSVYLR